MFATSAMRYVPRAHPSGCGYGVALNVDCKTMRLPRPFLILSHFPYFCNTRVHFLALTAGACYLFLPRLLRLYATYFLLREFFSFLFFRFIHRAPVSRAFSLHTNVSERSLSIQYPNFRGKKRKKNVRRRRRRN